MKDNSKLNIQLDILIDLFIEASLIEDLEEQQIEWDNTVRELCKASWQLGPGQEMEFKAIQTIWNSSRCANQDLIIQSLKWFKDSINRTVQNKGK